MKSDGKPCPNRGIPDAADQHGRSGRCAAQRRSVPRERRPGRSRQTSWAWASQKATDIRRVIAEVEANRQSVARPAGHPRKPVAFAPATSWPEGPRRRAYVLNLVCRRLAVTDTITVTSWRPCSRILPGSPMRAENENVLAENLSAPSSIARDRVAPPEKYSRFKEDSSDAGDSRQ